MGCQESWSGPWATSSPLGFSSGTEDWRGGDDRQPHQWMLFPVQRDAGVSAAPFTERATLSQANIPAHLLEHPPS